MTKRKPIPVRDADVDALRDFYGRMKDCSYTDQRAAICWLSDRFRADERARKSVAEDSAQGKKP